VNRPAVTVVALC